MLGEFCRKCQSRLQPLISVAPAFEQSRGQAGMEAAGWKGLEAVETLEYRVRLWLVFLLELQGFFSVSHNIVFIISSTV